ncbi:acyltransferase family protein [Microbacterium sp. NPDC055903]
MPESPETNETAPRTRAEAAATRRGGDIRTALERHSRRIGWMDVLRGLSILLVILHHSTQTVEYRIGDLPEFFVFLSDFFAPFRMPMLMFLSGLLVAGSLKRPTGEYVWGKIRRILWPILVWTLIYAAMEFVVDGAFSLDLFNTYLWFMQFVLAYYLIALVIRWIPIWLLIVLPLVGAFVVTDPDLHLLQRFFYLMPFFFLGAFVEKYWDRYARVLSAPTAAVLTIVPLAIAVYSGVDGQLALAAGREGGGGLWYQPLAAIPAMIGILILVRIAATIPDVRWLAPVRFVGRYSLIYYTSHYPVFAALGWLAAKAGLSNPTVALIVIFAATVAVSTVLAVLGRRMPVSLLFELPRRLWPARATGGDRGSGAPSRPEGESA